jgi:hypothetical protein
MVLTEVPTRMKRSWMLTRITTEELEWHEYCMGLGITNVCSECEKTKTSSRGP